MEKRSVLREQKQDLESLQKISDHYRKYDRNLIEIRKNREILREESLKQDGGYSRVFKLY